MIEIKCDDIASKLHFKSIMEYDEMIAYCNVSGAENNNDGYKLYSWHEDHQTINLI